MSDYDNLPVDGIPENDDDYDDYYEGLGEA